MLRPKAFLAPLLLLFVLGFALSACGGDDDGTTAETQSSSTAEEEKSQAGGSEPAPSGDAALSEKVEIVNFAYDPEPVTVEEGGKVIWMNEDAAPHTATAEDGSFDTGTIEEGKLKSETFKEPGTYAYICSIHPEMHGTVEVVPSG